MYNYYICLQICLHLDISLFTGTKILPDPHYKPPKDKKKNSGNAVGCVILPKVLEEISPMPNPIPIHMNDSPNEKKSNFLHV